MSAEIRVRGEGEVRCLADRASLRISVEAEAESQADAFTVASRSAATVDGVLDRYGEAIDRRFTAGVLGRPKTRLRKGRNDHDRLDCRARHRRRGQGFLRGRPNRRRATRSRSISRFWASWE